MKEKELLKEVDWIISIMLLIYEIKSYFDLKWMNVVESVYFINVGWGVIVDENVLVEVIE